MDMKLVETKIEVYDMQMDELAMFWGKREDDFSDELTEREETNCCGVLPVQPI